MRHLKVYNKQEVLKHTTIRRFETKIGERIQVINDPKQLEESLQNSNARYVVVGVSESIGAKANLDLNNKESVWLPFLRTFLNIQSNDFLEGGEILLLGHFDFDDLSNVIEQSAQSTDEKIDAYRHAVNIIDDEVEQIVQIITQNKKLPIVIGGGQNNAYPCIKGASKGWFKSGVIPFAQINAINVDARADYRPLEGRHNGNAFRYAEEDGYLEKYCVVGLHENEIQQNVWMDIVNNPFMDCITFEDIFLHEKRTFLEAIDHATEFTIDTLCGIELDLGSVERGTATGISAIQARQYLYFAALDSQPAYLHICEGDASSNDNGKDNSIGCLISYLVTDFIKALLQGY
jgi:formiminoglutamase